MAMSRSVTMPTTRSRSATGKTPISISAITLAAARMLCFGFVRRTSRVIASLTRINASFGFWATPLPTPRSRGGWPPTGAISERDLKAREDLALQWPNRQAQEDRPYDPARARLGRARLAGPAAPPDRLRGRWRAGRLRPPLARLRSSRAAPPARPNTAEIRRAADRLGAHRAPPALRRRRSGRPSARRARPRG